MKPDDLVQPEFPVTLALVWKYFKELSAARTSNGFGINPITYGEIRDWDYLTQAGITPSEVRIIRNLDALYLVHYAKRMSKTKADKG